MEQEFEKILNILDAERLKPNIHFVSLYVLYYECLKDSLVDLPKSFFCNHIEFKDGTMHVHESDAYKEKVRKLDKHIENASFKWFVSLGAVSEEEYSTFEKLKNLEIRLFMKSIPMPSLSRRRSAGCRDWHLKRKMADTASTIGWQ